MPTPFSSARAQALITAPTGYRRVFQCVFSRNGVSAILEPVNGSFTQDTRRSARWDGRLTFTGLDQLPVRPGDLLTPFGTRVSVQAGIELLDGRQFLVPYGVYEIATSSATRDASQRDVSVGLIDLSDRVNRYRFEQPLTLEGGDWIADMVNEVVRNRTGFSANVPPGGIAHCCPFTLGLEAGDGPWDELQDLAESYGASIWYDRSGQVRITETNIDPNDSYPLTGTVSIAADFDNRPANVWVVRSEPQDGSNPIRAVAMDTDPGSPTFAGAAPGGSPYGRTTAFHSSPLIRNQGQANATAAALLAESIGGGATHTVTWPYNPTVDAGDVVSIDATTYVLDSVTLDITGGTTARAREIR